MSFEEKRRKQADYVAAHRAKQMAAGKCGVCKHREMAEGKKACSECLDRLKVRRKQRMADGLCGQCGNAPFVPGYTNCASCREQQARSGRKHKAKRRTMGKSSGLCLRCFKSAPEKGVSACRACLDLSVQHRFRRHHGIDPSAIAALPRHCSICGSTEDLHIDHDHDTNMLRGRLCGMCNKGLGMFRDSPELLLKACRYLNMTKPSKVAA